MPLRSLNRSSGCGAPALGAAFGGEVSDEELPHSARTVDETGWEFSSAWNSERNIGAPCGEAGLGADADAILTAVLADLEKDTDTQVLLVQGPPELAKTLAEKYPGFDIVVGTSAYPDPPDDAERLNGGKTLLVVHELYPSKEALDGARASGVEAGTLEAFEQLDELLVTLVASVGRS